MQPDALHVIEVHHGAHREPLRSGAFHQCGRAGAWWLVWVRRAELLRACCAKWLGSARLRGVTSLQSEWGWR
jgi:hypothetical protein